LKKMRPQEKKRQRRTVSICEVSLFLWKRVIYLFCKKARLREWTYSFGPLMSYGAFNILENSCKEKLEVINLRSSGSVLLQCLKVGFGLLAFCSNWVRKAA